MQDTDLDDLFAKARADSPVPSAALVTRILDDADAIQQSRAAPAHSPEQRRRFSWIAAIGGGGVFAGLATATLAGLWLGIAQPAPVGQCPLQVIHQRQKAAQ